MTRRMSGYMLSFLASFFINIHYFLGFNYRIYKDYEFIFESE